jgi:hypothetical protein
MSFEKSTLKSCFKGFDWSFNMIFRDIKVAIVVNPWLFLPIFLTSYGSQSAGSHNHITELWKTDQHVGIAATDTFAVRPQHSMAQLAFELRSSMSVTKIDVTFH